MRINLHDLVAEQAASRPEAPAVSVRKVTVSYGQLWSDIRRVAGGLQQFGLAREDRVAVYLDKRVETVASIFGISAAGGVFVPVNPLLRSAQVRHILKDCQVRMLITTPERLALLSDDLDECTSLTHVILVGAGSPDGQVATYQVCGWDSVLQAGTGDLVPAGVLDCDIAAILYTSGSTGKAKGVVLSHRNLIAGAESVAHYLHNDGDDVILSALPLSFDAGFSQLTTAFSVGAHVVLLNYLLAADVPRLCAKHGVTGLTCVAPLWIQLADQTWPDEARASLRYFANTGGRLPKPTLDALRDQFLRARPYLMYGLTEAFRSTYLDPSEIDRRPGSIGKAIPNAEVLVVRPDGSTCDPGEEGELVHRGPLVALGYWNDPVRTAERFKPIPGRGADWRSPERAAWSGDTVVADEDGYLYFVGRNDDMIKTSGYRVSPTEIEEAAYATGLVRDAVALGVTDAALGQKIHLIVTPSGPSVDTDALRETLRAQVPLYMVPASITCRDEIPRSPNGKFDRVLLHREFGS